MRGTAPGQRERETARVDAGVPDRMARGLDGAGESAGAARTIVGLAGREAPADDAGARLSVWTGEHAETWPSVWRVHASGGGALAAAGDERCGIERECGDEDDAADEFFEIADPVAHHR